MYKLFLWFASFISCFVVWATPVMAASPPVFPSFVELSIDYGPVKDPDGITDVNARISFMVPVDGTNFLPDGPPFAPDSNGLRYKWICRDGAKIVRDMPTLPGFCSRSSGVYELPAAAQLAIKYEVDSMYDTVEQLAFIAPVIPDMVEFYGDVDFSDVTNPSAKVPPPQGFIDCPPPLTWRKLKTPATCTT